MEQLRVMFVSLRDNDVVPDVIVFLGNFTSRPFGQDYADDAQLRHYFKQLADLIGPPSRHSSRRPICRPALACPPLTLTLRRPVPNTRSRQPIHLPRWPDRPGDAGVPSLAAAVRRRRLAQREAARMPLR